MPHWGWLRRSPRGEADCRLPLLFLDGRGLGPGSRIGSCTGIGDLSLAGPLRPSCLHEGGSTVHLLGTTPFMGAGRRNGGHSHQTYAQAQTQAAGFRLRRGIRKDSSESGDRSENSERLHGAHPWFGVNPTRYRNPVVLYKACPCGVCCSRRDSQRASPIFKSSNMVPTVTENCWRQPSHG